VCGGGGRRWDMIYAFWNEKKESELSTNANAFMIFFVFIADIKVPCTKKHLHIIFVSCRVPVKEKH
jgi:hypothetical protein